ncbi:MAG: hypothetical protein JWL73_3048 [Actinomycetia bacterium]|nr:hypothetical protein [Actinomycetes bacterium]
MGDLGRLIEPGIGSVVLHVHVQPRSGRDAIAGRHDGALKVRVRAAPVDGAANDAVGDLLAARIGVPRRCVELASGATSRKKRFRIDGLDAATLEARLVELLDGIPGQRLG